MGRRMRVECVLVETSACRIWTQIGVTKEVNIYAGGPVGFRQRRPIIPRRGGGVRRRPAITQI
jgi:hypothetical protein